MTRHTPLTHWVTNPTQPHGGHCATRCPCGVTTTGRDRLESEDAWTAHVIAWHDARTPSTINRTEAIA